MADFLLLERLHKMIKEIPRPRLMFKKGLSVRGFFRPYMSFSDYTMSSVFGSINEITPVTVRFSSMIGDRGTADTSRNIKCMGIKFRTEAGNHDMICSSLPVQFINDKDKLMGMFGMFCIRRHFDGINKAGFWKFIVDNPEALNCAIRLFSYEGIADSYIYIKWYSVNNIVWHNDKGDKWLVRYKWLPVHEEDETGRQRNTRNRNYAEFAAGFDPDIAISEIENSILKKKFPSFELYIQMLPFQESPDSMYLDGTLMWDETKNPYMSVGIMMLDELPEDDTLENNLSFVPGSDIRGISLHRTELTEVVDYMCRIEEMERGAGI